MSIIEQKPVTGVILQRFTYRKPSECQLKKIFYSLGTRTSLAPNITQGVIEAEGFDEENNTPIWKASITLWNRNSGIRPETLTEAASILAECSQLTILEILSL